MSEPMPPSNTNPPHQPIGAPYTPAATPPAPWPANAAQTPMPTYGSMPTYGQGAQYVPGAPPAGGFTPMPVGPTKRPLALSVVSVMTWLGSMGLLVVAFVPLMMGILTALEPDARVDIPGYDAVKDQMLPLGIGLFALGSS